MCACSEEVERIYGHTSSTRVCELRIVAFTATLNCDARPANETCLTEHARQRVQRRGYDNTARQWWISLATRRHARGHTRRDARASSSVIASRTARDTRATRARSAPHDAR